MTFFVVRILLRKFVHENTDTRHMLMFPNHNECTREITCQLDVIVKKQVLDLQIGLLCLRFRFKTLDSTNQAKYNKKFIDGKSNIRNKTRKRKKIEIIQLEKSSEQNVIQNISFINNE